MVTLPFPHWAQADSDPRLRSPTFWRQHALPFVLDPDKTHLPGSLQFATTKTSPKVKIEVSELDLERQEQEEQGHRTVSKLL